MNYHAVFLYLIISSLLFAGGIANAQSTNTGDVGFIQQPSYEPVCAGEGTTLSVELSGNSLSYQWEVSDGSGFRDLTDTLIYTGSQTAELNIATISSSMNLYQYRCKIGEGANQIFSKELTISLKNALINHSPSNAIGYEGEYHSFEIHATGDALVYQWQDNKGEGFVNIEEGKNYRGSQTRILSIPEVLKKMDAYQFRCIVSGEFCEAATLISESATFTVKEEENPLKSIIASDPSTILWYMNAGTEGDNNSIWFRGNPLIYIDGAMKMENNGQMASVAGDGVAEIKITGHIFNENTDTNLFSDGDDTQFTFIGDNEQEIKPNTATPIYSNFHALQLDKPSNNLSLQDDIAIRGQIEFGLGGNISLNGNNIELTHLQANGVPYALSINNFPSFPLIINENEAARISTPGMPGKVLIKDLSIVSNPSPAGLNLGNIGAEIIDPDDFLAGKIFTLKREHIGGGINVLTSIHRSYTIELDGDPAIPLPSNIGLRFNYLETDNFNQLIEEDLDLYKSETGINNSWVNQESNVPVIAPPDRYVQKDNNIEDLTGVWRLFPCNNILGIALPSELHMCDGEPYTVATSFTGSGGATFINYEWFLLDENGTVIQNTSGPGNLFFLTGMEGTPDQTLIVRATDPYGCGARDTITIFHEDAISVDLPFDSGLELCRDAGPQTLTVSVPDAVNYDWTLNSIVNLQTGINNTFIFNPTTYQNGLLIVDVTASTLHCSASDFVDITVNALPQADLGPDIITCNQGTTQLDANPSNGSGNYTDISWFENGSTMAFTSGNPISVNNDNVKYAVMVTDDNGCTGSSDIEISFSNIMLSETHDLLFCGDDLADIDLTVSGGLGTYNYLWSSGQNTQDLSGLSAGTYTVSVSDDTAPTCIAKILSIEILASVDLVVTSTTTEPLCFGSSTGSIDLTVAGGQVPYTYLWSNGEVTQDLVNIIAGTYDVTVTDANLCTAESVIMIDEPEVLISDPSNPAAITDVLCFGDNTGAINNWTVIGGIPPYTYLWSNGETTQDLANIVAGTYDVTVTDANLCTFNSSFLVSQPTSPINVDVSSTDITCNGFEDGTIILTVSGGANFYTFDWDDLPGTNDPQDRLNLPPGAYNVTVTDNNNCTNSPFTITINELTVLSTVAQITDLVCSGNNTGSITLNPAGESGVYSFLWSGPNAYSSIDENITLLAPGDYNVTLADATNSTCIYTETYTVNSPNEILLNELVDQISCTGNIDGMISLGVTGGTIATDYTYEWAGNLGGNSSTGNSLNNLGQGVYGLTVTDDNACQKIETFTIIEPAVLAATGVANNISCNDNNNGFIDLTVTGGTSPTFNWTGSNGYMSTDQNINNLAPETYDVTVSDINSCPGPTLNFTLTEPEVLTIDPIIFSPISCFGEMDGQINLQPSGGTLPYTVNWVLPDGTDITTSNSFLSNLSQSGTYNFYVDDANFCPIPGENYTIELLAPNEIIIADVLTNVLINGQSTGAIDLTVTGGTEVYDYLWSNGAMTEDLLDLPAGTYTVTVTDDSGCIKEETYTVTEPEELVINLQSLLDDACYQGGFGVISIFASGGMGPYTHSWSNGENNSIIYDLFAGDYTVTVTDANGAEAIETYTVNEADQIDDGAVLVEVSCNGFNDGSISLNPTWTGPTVTFDYNWSNGANTNSITSLSGGDYTVTISYFPPSSEAFCEFIETYTISESSQIVIDATTITEVSCFGEADGNIDLSVSGGVSPYTYNWTSEGLTGNGSGTTIAGLIIGNYNITITDANNCTISTNALVDQPPFFSVTIIGGNSDLCVGESTVLDAGTGFASYLWSTGETTQTITVDSGNNYGVTVTNAINCEAEDSFLITTFPVPTLSIDNTDCALGNLTYSIELTSNGESVSSTFGTVTDNLDGTFTISAILADQDVSITAEFLDPPCPTILDVNAPDCSCPTVLAPTNIGDVTICADEAIPTLDATVESGETVDWYDASTDGTLLLMGNTSFTPIAAGVFYAEAREIASGCTSSTRTPISLTINTLPITDAGMDSDICEGSSINLDASGSTGSGSLTYLWSPATGLSATNIVNPVASPTSMTTYTVLVTDANNCSASAEVLIDVNPVPIFTITGANCSPDLATYSIDLTTTSSYMISSTQGVVTDNGGNTYTIDGISAGADATITALNTTTNCSSSELVGAPDCNCPTVNAPLSMGDETICVGEVIPSLEVTVGTDETVDWYDASIGGMLLLSDNSVFTPIIEGTYYAETRNIINGCTSSLRTAVELIINPLPTALAGMDIDICEGFSTTLDASGSTGSGSLTYLWSPATGLSATNISNPIANPTSMTIYTVLVTDANNCSASSEVIIDVNPLPSLTITGTSCSPDLTTYTIELTASGDIVNSTQGVVTDNGGNSYTITGIPSGTDVSVTTSINTTSCVFLENVIAPDCACPIIVAPISDGDEIICAGDPFPSLSGTVGVDETIDWYDSDIGGILLLLNSTTYNPISGGTYYAETRNTITNCTSDTRTPLSLIINAFPVVDTGADVNICIGSSTNLDGSGSTGNGLLSYLWSPSTGLSSTVIAAPIANPSISTLYTLEITDGNGCTETGTVNVTVNPLPFADAGEDLSICTGASTQLNANGSTGNGLLTYLWSPTTGLSSSTIVDPLASPIITTTYTVEVTDENGCTSSANIEVMVNSLPTLSIGNTNCAADLLTYNLDLTTNGDVITVDFGTIIDNGGETYSVTGIPIGQNVDINTSISGTLCQLSTVIFSPSCPCPLVNAPLSGGDAVVCASQPIPVLTAIVEIDETVDWYDAAVGGVLLSVGSTNYTPTVAGIYYATARNTINNCTSATRTGILLIINPSPQVNAGMDVDICVGESAPLDGSGSTGNGLLTYLWSPAASLNAANIANPIATPLLTTTYNLVVTDVDGCSASEGVSVTVNPVPFILGTTTVCDPSLLTYSVNLITAATNVTASFGTVVNTGLNAYEINNIPAGQDESVIAAFLGSNCQTTAMITAPDCSCPIVNTPINAGDETICGEELIPFLLVSVDMNETVDWYDASIGGNLLLAGSTSYMPTAAGTFYAEARNTINNCTSVNRVPVTLTIYPLVVADAGTAVDICQGFSTQLDGSASSGSGNLIYLWSPNIGLSNINIANPIADPSITTSYTLTVSDENGCANSISGILVTVNPLPMITIENIACSSNLLTYEVEITTEGDNVTSTIGTVQDNGGGSYLIVNIAAGEDITITSEIGTTLCQQSQGVTAPNCDCPMVNAPINVGDFAFCIGEIVPQLTVNVNMGETVDWYDSPIGGTLLLAGNTEYQPEGEGIFYAETRELDSNCTSSIRTPVVLSANPLPLADAGSDFSTCMTAGFTLDAGGSTGNGLLNYFWSPGTGLNANNIPNPTVDPFINPTTYTVEITDINGCSSIDEVFVAATEPSIADAGEDVEICEQSSTVLDASSSTGTGNLDYEWTPITGLNANNITNPTASPAVTTTYTLEVQDEEGCTSTDVVVVTVVSFITVDAGSDAIICEGNEISLNGSAGGNVDDLTYSWSPSISLSATNIPNPVANPTITTTYTLEVSNATGCSGMDEILIVVNPAPTVDGGSNEVICLGESIELDASNSTGIGTLSYSWSPAAGLSATNIVNPMASPVTTTTYTVEVSDVNGCLAAGEVLVSVNPLPQANAGQDVEICLGEDINLDGSGSSGNSPLSYLWSPAIGLSATDIANPTANPTETTIYTLEVFDDNGCGSQEEVTVTVNALPEATITNKECTIDLLSYFLTFSTDGTEVSASLGSVVDDGGGFFTITDIPGGQTVVISLLNTNTTCESTQIVEAPDCDCIGTNAPISNGDLEVCEGAPFPELMVSVDVGETADWYDSATAGTLLSEGSTTYTPMSGGVFYVEARSLITNCTSETRTNIVLSVNPLPMILFEEPGGACPNAMTITLLASPLGGTFSGVGVNGNQFEPTVSGIFPIVYTYTDLNGCTNSVTENMEVFDLPIVSVASNSPVCEGDNLVLTEVGNSAIDWIWSTPSGAILNEQSPTISPFTVLEEGMYSLTVTGSNGCTNTSSIDALLNPEILAVVTPNPAFICVDGMVDLTVMASGGTGILNYTWISPSGNNSSGSVITADVAGDYFWTAMDDSGCSLMEIQTVNEHPVMTVDFTDISADCSSLNGSLTANVNGGIGSYSYNWEGLVNTTNMLTDVSAGNYSLTVTDDDTACTISAIGTVDNNSDLEIIQENIMDVLCAGGSTGNIDISIEGGIAPYIVNWSNGANSEDLNDLESGIYSVEVSDASACIAAAVIVVEEPSVIVITSVTTTASTTSSLDGVIDLTVNGGTFPYDFIWNTGSPTEDISNLMIGSYTVTITDDNGCLVVETIDIVTDTPFSVTINIVQGISCNGGSDGTIEAIVSGVNSPFSYIWNTGGMLSNLDNLAAGTYTVTVMDQNSVIATESINLGQPTIIEALSQVTDVLCNGDTNGEAMVSVVGGTFPYLFNWSAGDTGPIITGQSPGFYMVTITDDLGCNLEQIVEIEEPEELAIPTALITDVACFEGMNGAIDISIEGGTMPYSTNWSQGAITEDINGQMTGSYSVLVTDFNQCTVSSEPYVIAESDEIEISFIATGVLCFGDATGDLTATVIGGSPAPMGYQYNWVDGQSTAFIDNLVSDNYFLTVTDNLGCTQVNNFFVGQSPELTNTFSFGNISCFGLNDGFAMVEGMGGALPYNYLWSNGDTDELAEDLIAGTYTVTITDGNNCTLSVTDMAQIMEPTELAYSFDVTDLNCFEDFGGAIELSITGGTTVTGDYTTVWSSGQFTEDIDQLAAGNYEVTITDDNSCQVADLVTVGQPDAILVTESIENVQCFGEGNGSVQLTANGGVGLFDFIWSEGTTALDINTSQVSELSQGIYTSTITDENGCELIQQYEVTEPDLLAIDFNIQRAGCTTDNDGDIDLTISGGSLDYTFNWSNGAITEDIDEIVAGNYDVAISDMNGCELERSFTVAETDTTFTAYFRAASGLFDVDTVEVFSGELIQFVDVSYPIPLTWDWSFNNPLDNTSELPNPVFSYSDDPSEEETAYFPKLVVTNAFCIDSLEKTIWITNNFRLTAPQIDTLAYLEFKNVNVYPNPSTGKVTVDVELSDEQNLSLKIIDAKGIIHDTREEMGQEIYSINLDMSHLGPGIYFIHLYSNKRMHTSRVIIVED
jgi:hypothetical protein